MASRYILVKGPYRFSGFDVLFQNTKFFRSIVALFFLELLFASVSAQNYLTVKGKISNADNEEPINAVGIFIKKSGLGTVSNEAGEFTFHIPEQFSSDTLYFSSLGYKNYKIALTKIKDPNVLNIQLKPFAHELNQVIVKRKNKKGTAEKLIRKAIDSMEFNYPQKPFQIGGYYRDYLEKQHKYSNLFEAAIEVEDMGFTSDDAKTSRLRLLQMRYSPKYLFDSSQIMLYDNKKMKFIPGAYINPMDGNEFLILRSHDALRNYNKFTLSFLDYFSKSFIRNHDFKIDSITYLNDTQVYSISFKYNNRYGYDSAANFSASGYLVLRKDNLAISKLVYNTYIFDRDYDGQLYNLVIDYRELEGRYYPQYLSFGNYFKIRNRIDTSSFVLKQTALRKNSKVLDLTFNRSVDTITGNDTSSFSVRYGKIKIPVQQASVKNNIVRLLLNIDRETLMRLTDEGDLTLTIGELADAWGNRMAGKYNGYYQHREFYINKVNPTVVDEFPYSQIIPKTMPLYWNPLKTDPDFWKTYNAAYEQKLE